MPLQAVKPWTVIHGSVIQRLAFFAVRMAKRAALVCRAVAVRGAAAGRHARAARDVVTSDGGESERTSLRLPETRFVLEILGV